MRTIFPLVVLLASTLPACAPDHELDLADYSIWISAPEHGLVKEKKVGDIRIRLEYEPPHELVVREHGPVCDSLLESLSARKEGALYFKLMLGSDGGTDLLGHEEESSEEYLKRVFYFDYLVENDLMLIIGQDTVPCAMSHMERTYGATPYLSLVSSFIDEGRTGSKDDIRFIYNDRIYGLGRTEFVIRRSDLEQLPRLRSNLPCASV